MPYPVLSDGHRKRMIEAELLFLRRLDWRCHVALSERVHVLVQVNRMRCSKGEGGESTATEGVGKGGEDGIEAPAQTKTRHQAHLSCQD